MAGSSTKLNVITGISKIMHVTAQDFTTYAERILDAGIRLVEDNQKIYLTDGTTKLSNLQPRVDKLLVATEKDALTKTFSGEGGAYKATEGGFLVLGADGKIQQAELPSGFLDSDGKISLNLLPDTVRAGIKYVATYDQLTSLSDEEKKLLVVVLDASGDPTVTSGAASYVWVDTAGDGSGFAWKKMSEVESLDLDIASIETSTKNVEAANAVMYDHPIVLTAPTLAQYVTLADAHE